MARDEIREKEGKDRICKASAVTVAFDFILRGQGLLPTPEALHDCIYLLEKL